MFLTPAEVQRITRKTQRAAQKRVLGELGYHFEEDAAGWPLVLCSTVEARHQAKSEKAGREPDSAALAALQTGR